MGEYMDKIKKQYEEYHKIEAIKKMFNAAAGESITLGSGEVIKPWFITAFQSISDLMSTLENSKELLDLYKKFLAEDYHAQEQQKQNRERKL